MRYISIVYILCIFCSTVQAWTGRVLPVSFDKNTKEWSLLLGHDKGSNIWSDFSGNGTGTGVKANFIALQALKVQTKGMYNFDATLTSMPSEHDITNDAWFHVLKVPYVSGKDLYLKATNNIKDDFKWIPLDEALKSNQVNHKKGGTIEKNLYNFIQGSLQTILQKIPTTDGSGNITIDCPDTEFKNKMTNQQWPTTKTQGIEVITFYNKDENYYSFANTFTYGGTDPLINTIKEYKVTIFDVPSNQNLTWDSTEHYFQGGKFTNPANYVKDINKHTAGQLQSKARQKQYPFDQIKSMWDNIKEWIGEKKNIDRMVMAVATKFLIYSELQTLLVKTKGAIIVEDAGINDPFWGAGPNYTGCNHLGQILMQVRDRIIDLNNKGITLPTSSLYMGIKAWFEYQPHPPDFYLNAYKNNQLVLPQSKVVVDLIALDELGSALNSLV